MEVMKKEISKQVDRVKNDLIQLSKTISEDAELSFKEHKAAGWLTGELKTQGFDIKYS